MNTIRTIDGWLLHHYERAAHWFQKWTGRSCFWLYGLTALTMVGCWIFVITCGLTGFEGVPFLLLTSAGDHSVLMGVLSFIGIAFFSWEGIFYWRVLEDLGFARLERGVANPEKSFAPQRYYFLLPLAICDAAMNVAGHHFNIVFFACFSGAYWRACDPLPPCTGKLFELWTAHDLDKAEVPA